MFGCSGWSSIMPSSDETSPPVVVDDEMANSVLSCFISVPEQTYEEFLSTFTRLPPGWSSIMPSSDETSPPVVTDDEMANSVLSRFISVPEQTYEEFLSTFTRLPPGTGRQQPEVMFDGSQMKTRSLKTPQRTEDKTGAGNEQDEPEQLTIGEGTTVGICHSLTHPGRVQVDNYFNSSDIDTGSDNDETGPGVLLFPGEAELDLDGSNKTIVRNTCLQSHTSSGVESTAVETCALSYRSGRLLFTVARIS
ncbi:intraflagellar transport-associated protein isoform X2 [Phyllobates terribilis]|uniref:intraflagellar transport-associated protein isoform X2 n=1 Tax=Phyllobates terribilis TaxID=111132 RepID=UPI003CCAF9C1